MYVLTFLRVFIKWFYSCTNQLLFLLLLHQSGVFFGIINQIYHASVGILMECLPSGRWFSLGLRPRENHLPSGRHSIRIPTLAWHICIIMSQTTQPSGQALSGRKQQTISCNVLDHLAIGAAPSVVIDSKQSVAMS